MTQTCARPIGGVGIVAYNRYRLPNNNIVNLSPLDYEDACSNYNGAFQIPGNFFNAAEEFQLYIYPGITEGVNVAKAYELAGSKCFCPSIESNYWVNFTDPQAPPTTTSNIYWMSIDSNCNVSFSACSIVIPETPTPTPTPTVTRTLTPTPTQTQTPTQTEPRLAILKSQAGALLSVSGVKNTVGIFEITYNLGLGGPDVLYNRTGFNNFGIGQVYSVAGTEFVLKNPNSLNNSTIADVYIRGVSEIGQNNILFYFNRFGSTSVLHFHGCSFPSMSNLFVGNQNITQFYFSACTNIHLNDSTWPQGFLNNTFFGNLRFVSMIGPYSIDLNGTNMTKLSYIGNGNLNNGYSPTTLRLVLPTNFGGTTSPGSAYNNNSIKFSNCDQLTSLTFPNASSVDGGPLNNIMGINVQNCSQLLTLGDIPKNCERIIFVGAGQDEATTSSLTSCTIDFSNKPKLVFVRINQTRLNNTTFPSGASGVHNASLVTELNLFGNFFASWIQLPPALQILNLGNNKLTSQPPGTTYFPSTIRTISLVNNGTGGGGLNNIPTWTYEISSLTQLTSFSLSCGLTSWGVPFPPSIQIVNFTTNLLTTFNTQCFSASTSTNPIVSVTLTDNNLTSMTIQNFGTLKEIIARSNDFPSQDFNGVGTVPVGITKLDLGVNGITVLNWNKGFSSTLNYVDLARWGLTQTSIDYILSWFANTANNNLSNGTIILNNPGVTNAQCTANANNNCNSTPTNGINNASRLLLVARGWTVTVEPTWIRL